MILEFALKKKQTDMATDSRSLGTKQVQFKKKEMIEWDEMLETKNKGWGTQRTK